MYSSDVILKMSLIFKNQLNAIDIRMRAVNASALSQSFNMITLQMSFKRVASDKIITTILVR